MTTKQISRFSIFSLARRIFASLDRLLEHKPQASPCFEPLEPRIALAAGINATYYNNEDFTGTSVTRVDSRILNNWAEGVSPAPGIDPGTYSVRWEGYVRTTAESGLYTFHAFVEGGVRLWVNDVLVINDWDLHTLIQSDSPNINLPANTATKIKFEFHDQNTPSIAMLVWTLPTGGQEAIPTSRYYTEPTSFPPQVYYIVGPIDDPVRAPVDSVQVRFDQILDETTFDWSDIGLYRNGSPTNLITSGDGLSISPVEGAPETYLISGLSQYTSITASYSFKASASAVKNLAGTSGTGSISYTWNTNILTVTQVNTPASIQSGPLSTVPVTFSTGITPSTFTWEDLILTRDGSPNLINASTAADITITPTGSPLVYNVGGLESLTATAGEYTLTVYASTILAAGSPGLGYLQGSWDTDTLTIASLAQPASIRTNPVFEVPVRFDKPIDLASFTWADLTLTRNGGANLITGSSGITIQLAPGETSKYLIKGLSSLTNATGNYTLTVNGAGILLPSGAHASNSLSTSWTTSLLKVTTLGQPTTNRTNPVYDTAIRFSEPINPATFTWADVTLTRDGGPNLISDTSGLSIQLAPGETTKYLIKGLAPLTSLTGTYTLTVSAAGIQSDTAPISGTGSQSVTWASTLLTPVSLTQPSGVQADPLSQATIEFSSPIDLATFTWADLSLTRSGSANLITSGSGITIELAPGETSKYLIKGLTSLTSLSGNYALTVNAANIKSASGPWGYTSITSAWTSDILTISNIGQPATNRSTPVYSVAVRFSKPIDLATFTWADILLTFNAGANLITSGAGLTITLNPGETSVYTISGLAPLTSAPGSYTLTINPAGINAATSGTGYTPKSIAWTKSS